MTHTESDLREELWELTIDYDEEMDEIEQDRGDAEDYKNCRKIFIDKIMSAIQSRMPVKKYTHTDELSALKLALNGYNQAIDEVSKALGLTDKPEEEPDGMTDDERSEALKGEKERNNDKTLHSEKDVNEEENPPLPDEIVIDEYVDKTGAVKPRINVWMSVEYQIEELAKQHNALLRFIKANR